MPTELLYRIIDEPRGSPWRAWVVKPFWPWIALMLGGVWVGAPWFIFNSVAMGSPSRAKEIVASASLPFVLGGSFFALVVAGQALNVPEVMFKYMVLPGVLMKMVIGYFLFITQSRAFQLHEHFGQPARNGAFIAVAAFFLRDRVLDALPTFVKLSLL
jgi:hypothetical protein